jgi:hypothetical protein
MKPRPDHPNNSTRRTQETTVMTLIDYAPYALMVLTALAGLACWAYLKTPPLRRPPMPPQPGGTTMTLSGEDGSVDLDDPFTIELVD